MNYYRSVQSRFAGSLPRSPFGISALMCLSMFVMPVFAQYKRTDLVSNQAGMAANQDQRLVNGWGLVALPTSSDLFTNGGCFDSSVGGGGPSQTGKKEYWCADRPQSCWEP
jgi:hypothetical protein